jgi:1,4-dihydroxy-2-naphthoate octaprenyltransferase
MLLVFLALKVFWQVLPMFRQPRPAEKPARNSSSVDFPDVWPNYFVAAAFQHNRRFGLLFLLGLILDTVLRAVIL